METSGDVRVIRSANTPQIVNLSERLIVFFENVALQATLRIDGPVIIQVHND